MTFRILKFWKGVPAFLAHHIKTNRKQLYVERICKTTVHNHNSLQTALLKSQG